MGKTRGICNIAAILKMEDPDRVEGLPKWRRKKGKLSVSYVSLVNLSPFVGYPSLTKQKYFSQEIYHYSIF